jgi:hypothetical protein
VLATEQTANGDADRHASQVGHGVSTRNGGTLAFRGCLLEMPMTRSARFVILAYATLLAACATTQPKPPERAPDAADPLFETISQLDTAVFDAFNQCSDPAQLQRHASYFDEDVEFYHDKGGVTWNRKDMLANTEKYVCGHFARKLVSGSLRVYPIKDFGAIEQGTHTFCQFKDSTCEGAADFLIVWRNDGGIWRVTRVMSYGHRANR